MSEDQQFDINNRDVNKDFFDDHLTVSNRLIKGYNFEMQIQNLLDRNSFSYAGNPKSFEEWKKKIGKGADIIIKINGKSIEIECKYLESVAYPSYIHRDYIPRFSLNSDIKIIVTNDKWRLTYHARNLLRQYHIKLFNDYELLWYLIKKSPLKGNKSILNIPLKSYSNRYESSTLSFDCVFESGNFKVKADSELGNKAEKEQLYRSGNIESETVLEGLL